MKAHAAAAAILLAAAIPLAGAQQEEFGHCGDITLIFMNPDLRPREDGFVYATGQFFIQFQAIGERAAEVAKIAFNFGVDLPEGTEQCDPLPVYGPPTGVYLLNYRSDPNGADGFFVPVNTTLVPDGTYGAAVQAYDANGNYLSQFFTHAKVENGPNCFGTLADCNDRTAPWPMILPGDGEQTNDIGGITIEFAEAVTDVFVRINGEQVIPLPWTPPARDDDAMIDNDDQDCAPIQGTLATVGYAGQNYVCHRTIWGSGFFLDRVPEAGDVIEVRAIDVAGNEATKIVTVGGITSGGTIQLTEPKLQMTTENVDQEAEAGQTAEYRLKLVNVGSGDAVVALTADAPANVTLAWSSPSVTVPAGSEQFVTLQATPSKDVTPGRYTIVSKASYKSGTEDATNQLNLNLHVNEFRPVPDSPLRRARANLTRTSEPGDAEGGEARATPGIEPAVAVALLGAAAFATRRRPGPPGAP